MKPNHEVLFIPGPVEVDLSLREILSRPLIGHRHKDFVALTQRVCEKLQMLFCTDRGEAGSTTLYENVPATALMEAGIRNLVPLGGRTLHLTCGAFSERWVKVSQSCGRRPEALAVDWGEANLPEALRNHLLDSAPYDAVCITHNETSTGVLNPLLELSATVRENSPNTLVLVDAVTSLGGAEMQFDDWGLDLAFAGTQKCLALPPGLTVYAISQRAMERAAAVEDRGFLLDFLKAKQGFEAGKTTATPNVPLVFALEAQLDRIAVETMDGRWQRHEALRRRVEHWTKEYGLCLFVAATEHRSPTVTTLTSPEVPIPDLQARAKAAGFALDRGYGKLKDQAFRIGHMGDHNVALLNELLAALC